MGWEIAVPVLMGIANMGMGYYNTQEQMGAMQDAAEQTHAWQQEYQKNQQDWYNKTRAENQAWVQAQQKAQEDSYAKTRAENQADYEKYAYANKEATDARRNSLVAEAANSRSEALDRLMQSLAARGIGGGGAAGKAVGEVEAKYKENIGKAYNDVTEFANKPFWQYQNPSATRFTPMQAQGAGNGIAEGSSAYGTGGYGSMSGGGGGGLGTALGLMMANQYRNNTPSTNYDTTNYATPQYDSSYYSMYNYPSSWGYSNYPSY